MARLQRPRVMRQRRRARGIALVAVLWALALIALLAAGFRAETMTALRTVRAIQEQAKARALADGAVHAATARLLTYIYLGRDRQAASALPVDGTPTQLSLLDGVATLSITDTGGLVDLNAASVPLLTGVLLRLGLERPQAAALAARIVDFRDLDHSREPGGAEDEDYLAAGLPYGAKDAPFDSVDELAQVLGFTFDLAARMKPYVTVMNGLTQIDPLVAPAYVLDAVPGLTPAARSSILGLRQRLGGIFRRAEQPVDSPFFGASTRSTYRIFATARTQGGAQFTREAVVQIRGSGRPPFFLRRWATQLTPPPAPPASRR